MNTLTRRTALIGMISGLGGCATLTSLNDAAKPLNTYDLRPAAGSQQGRRTQRTLLVAVPQASAALTSDRILIKPDPASITYLPDARWSDELPALVQSVLIRSVAQTGRISYVGRSGAGPVPDTALLMRIDAFEVGARGEGVFETAVDLDLTLINDRDQSVVATRRFAGSTQTASDQPAEIVAQFQVLMNDLLPDMSDWAIANA
jgi:cholesterol transport system auxiliary component